MYPAPAVPPLRRQRHCSVPIVKLGIRATAPLGQLPAPSSELWQLAAAGPGRAAGVRRCGSERLASCSVEKLTWELTSVVHKF